MPLNAVFLCPLPAGTGGFMLLKMEEIKAQLRLDEDFTDEDSLLTLMGQAAQSRTENFLNRRLYATAADLPEDDPDGLVMPDEVKLALLLLVTHYYENRSSVTEVEKLELPQSFNWLVGPYRYIPL
jgi:uncharacterized phage protein (predicted DNA packaging)